MQIKFSDVCRSAAAARIILFSYDKIENTLWTLVTFKKNI